MQSNQNKFNSKPVKRFLNTTNMSNFNSAIFFQQIDKNIAKMLHYCTEISTLAFTGVKPCCWYQVLLKNSPMGNNKVNFLRVSESFKGQIIN